MKFEDFKALADAERAKIAPSETSWIDSPFAWMLHNAPPVKNKFARNLVEAWARSKQKWEIGPGDGGGTFGYHFTINGSRVRVHFSVLGNNGQFLFSSLMAPEGGNCDFMLLLGIEPHRARIWRMASEACIDLPGRPGDHPALRQLKFKPDDWPNGKLRLYLEVRG